MPGISVGQPSPLALHCCVLFKGCQAWFSFTLWQPRPSHPLEGPFLLAECWKEDLDGGSRREPSPSLHGLRSQHPLHGKPGAKCQLGFVPAVSGALNLLIQEVLGMRKAPACTFCMGAARKFKLCWVSSSVCFQLSVQCEEQPNGMLRLCPWALGRLQGSSGWVFQLYSVQRSQRLPPARGSWRIRRAPHAKLVGVSNKQKVMIPWVRAGNFPFCAKCSLFWNFKWGEGLAGEGLCSLVPPPAAGDMASHGSPHVLSSARIFRAAADALRWQLPFLNVRLRRNCFIVVFLKLCSSWFFKVTSQKHHNFIIHVFSQRCWHHI